MAPKMKSFGRRYLKRTAFRRGLLGSSRGWLAAWVAMTGFGFLRRRIGRTEDVVYRTELHVGEHLVVEHRPAPEESRRRRKRKR